MAAAHRASPQAATVLHRLLPARPPRAGAGPLPSLTLMPECSTQHCPSAACPALCSRARLESTHASAAGGEYTGTHHGRHCGLPNATPPAQARPVHLLAGAAAWQLRRGLCTPCASCSLRGRGSCSSCFGPAAKAELAGAHLGVQRCTVPAAVPWHPAHTGGTRHGCGSLPSLPGGEGSAAVCRCAARTSQPCPDGRDISARHGLIQSSNWGWLWV